MTLLVTEYYKAELQQLHKVYKEWGHGVSVNQWKNYQSHLSRLNCTTILDYGCASGKFKSWMNKEHPEYSVFEYDPGVIGKDMHPKPADFVVCCDVLEHVEPELLDNVMAHLKSLILKGAYFMVCLVDAFTILPSNRNAHLLVKDAEWWVDKFQQYFNNITVIFKTKSHIGLCIEI